MPFIAKGSWNPNAGSYLIGGSGTGQSGAGLSTVITNSGVVRIGDVLAGVVSGSNLFARRYNAAGDAILGICVGVRRADGTLLSPDSGTTDTFTVASDNQTAAQIYAMIDASPYTIWSAPLDATINTTAAAVMGTCYDPDTGANAGRIAESSATRTLTNGRGLACHGADPEDTTRALVSIAESYLFAGLKGDS